MKTNTEMKNINELNLDDLTEVTGGTDRSPEASGSISKVIDWIISLFD